MSRNVIILTSGLSGSSVLTALLAGAGYWAGKNTAKKLDYDTFENQQLVELNQQLVDLAGFAPGHSYTRTFSQDRIDNVAEAFESTPTAPFEALLQTCQTHSPWVWKDPRLWLTIRFWANLLDLQQTDFLLLTRSPLQSWISSINRRHIETYAYTKQYASEINAANLAFLQQHNARYLELEYEQLLRFPLTCLQQLNDFLNTSLVVADLNKVYTGKLYRYPRGSRDFCRAVLIYLKNYGERQR